jgi:hypothetical protein
VFLQYLTFVVALAVQAPSASEPPAGDSLTEMRAAMSAALQADLKSALPHLRRVKPQDLAGERATVAACMRGRFLQDTSPPTVKDLDPWTAQVLAAYRRYWRSVMLGATKPDAAQAELAATLARSLKPDSATPDMAALEPLLQAKLEARGYHALFGITAPLREFMLWHKQTDETYDMDLPEGREAVHVTMMDDFVSLGWLGYATCDFYHSGGWATPERLFAVRSAYDLDSESFKVSYLAHEGQHFADYRRFPGLKQPELEYRAKLVELSRADTTLFQLIDSFSADGSDDRAQPHPWADRQVVRALAAKVLGAAEPSAEAWKAVPAERIRKAAAELLAEDTARREAEKSAKH